MWRKEKAQGEKDDDANEGTRLVIGRNAFALTTSLGGLR